MKAIRPLIIIPAIGIALLELLTSAASFSNETPTANSDCNNAIVKRVPPRLPSSTKFRNHLETNGCSFDVYFDIDVNGKANIDRINTDSVCKKMRRQIKKSFKKWEFSKGANIKACYQKINIEIGDVPKTTQEIL